MGHESAEPYVLSSNLDLLGCDFIALFQRFLTWPMWRIQLQTGFKTNNEIVK